MKTKLFTLLTMLLFSTVAQASKTANDTVISQQVQEYRVKRNVAGEEYVLLENIKTGEFYDSSSDYKGCEFWNKTKTGAVLKLKELSKTASWGNYKELSGIDVDICVPFYQSRNQL